MRIVIDFSSSQYRLTPNEIFFLDKCFQLIVKEQSEHEWIIEPFGQTKGVISLLPVGIKKNLLLDRINADALITTGEANKKSTPRLKQIFFFNQSYESYGRGVKALENASRIVTTSPRLKKKIIQSYSLQEDDVVVIPAAPSGEISLADWSEKLSVKDKYSDGREFFLCFKKITATSQWEEILKAFSIFKKWQQSSFKLLIAGKIDASFSEEFNQKFNSYKYRNDVMILDPDKEDIDRILPCAFGLICADVDYTGIDMLNAMSVEVPVISSPTNIFDEEVSGAFLPSLLFADELSRQIINLYRDERMREIMVEKGKQVAGRYDWDASVNSWTSLINLL